MFKAARLNIHRNFQEKLESEFVVIAETIEETNGNLALSSMFSEIKKQKLCLHQYVALCKKNITPFAI